MVQSCLPCSCGPGEHAIQLGLDGADQIVGLDLSREMLNFAEANAQSRGKTISSKIQNSEKLR